jgi:putative membrane protein
MSSTGLGAVVLEPTPAENFPLIASAAVAGMYWHGGRAFRAARRRGTLRPDRVRLERRRTVAFAAALLTLIAALQQPVDSLADRLLWMHMVQHVLLLTVVPPLVLLSAPWMRLWRAFPLAPRRSLARWVVKAPGASPLRWLVRVLSRPAVAWSLLAAGIIVWHVPSAYDLALHSNAVHYAEHATFLIVALLAWGQVIDSPPFHSALDHPRRVAFVLASMVPSWGLAIGMAIASRPWYAYYAHPRPGGITAITDQHLAGGVMWVPGSLTWSVAVFVLLYNWLRPLAPPTTELEPARLRALPRAPAGGGESARRRSRVPAGIVADGRPTAPARPVTTVRRTRA